MKKFFLFGIISFMFFINLGQTSQVFANTDTVTDSSTEVIFNDIDGILPIVKLIPYKFYDNGEAVAGEVTTGIVVSEDGLVITTNLQKNINSTFTPSIYEDIIYNHFFQDNYIDDYSDIIVNICFIYSDNPKNPVCNGIAEMVGQNNKVNFNVLKIANNDIYGNKLTFNFLNTDDVVDINPGDELKMIGFSKRNGGGLDVVDIKVEEPQHIHEGVYDYTQTGNNQKSGKGYAVLNQNNELVGQDMVFDDIKLHFLEPPYYSYFESVEDIYTCDSGCYDCDDWHYTACHYEENQFKDLNFINEYLNYYINEFFSIDTDLINKFSDYLKTTTPLYIPENWQIVSDQEGASDYWAKSFPPYGPFTKIVPVNEDKTYDDSTFVIIEEREMPFELKVDELKEIDDNQGVYLEWFTENEMWEFDYYDFSNIYSAEEFRDQYRALKVEACVYFKESMDCLKWVKYVVPNGNQVVTIKYIYDPDENYLDDINTILDSIVIEPEVTDQQSTIELFDEYLKITDNPDDNWYFYNQYEYNHSNDPLILKGWRRNDEWRLNDPLTKITFDNTFDYDYADIDHWYFASLTQHRPMYLDYYSEIIYKNEDMIIDGYKAYYVLSEGEYSYEEDIKMGLVTVYIFDEDFNHFEIRFETDLSRFEELVPEFEQLLYNIEVFDQDGPGEYVIPDLNDKLIVPDWDEHIYEEEIEYLMEEGVVQGYGYNEFRPDNNVNRAEFLKIVLEALEGESGVLLQSWKEDVEDKVSDYPDVDSDEWFGKYVIYATEKSIVEGYSDGYFYPGKEIILAEALKMIFLANDISIEIPEDLSENQWYFPYMDKAYRHNLLPEGVMKFDHVLTRGEICYIIYKVMMVYNWDETHGIYPDGYLEYIN